MTQQLNYGQTKPQEIHNLNCSLYPNQFSLINTYCVLTKQVFPEVLYKILICECLELIKILSAIPKMVREDADTIIHCIFKLRACINNYVDRERGKKDKIKAYKTHK